jgi:hypothetical protein
MNKESFLFEKKVIDPILNIIKDNQKYLTKKSNLPQLAKLGFIYNHFWYGGRVCWGHRGRLHDKDFLEYVRKSEYKDGLYKFYSCEDNPKYKIEMCDPVSDKIEDLIYDAWGMHVDDLETPISSDQFFKFIKEGRTLTEFELKQRKPNKTFEEWVDILTDEQYKYSSLYNDRNAILRHMFCTTGSGYKINKEGFICQTASGADEDISLYGDWENAVFREDIAKQVDEILSQPEVKQTLDEYYTFVVELKEKKQKEEDEQNKMFYEILESAGRYNQSEGRLSWDQLHNRIDNFYIEKGIRKKEEKRYRKYYPISNYSMISKFNKNTHPSYIQAGLEVCNNILQHRDEEEKDNIAFAEKYIKKFSNEKI